jgi:hypothetical protein
MTGFENPCQASGTFFLLFWLSCLGSFTYVRSLLPWQAAPCFRRTSLVMLASGLCLSAISEASQSSTAYRSLQAVQTRFFQPAPGNLACPPHTPVVPAPPPPPRAGRSNCKAVSLDSTTLTNWQGFRLSILTGLRGAPGLPCRSAMDLRPQALTRIACADGGYQHAAPFA